MASIGRPLLGDNMYGAGHVLLLHRTWTFVDHLGPRIGRLQHVEHCWTGVTFGIAESQSLFSRQCWRVALVYIKNWIQMNTVHHSMFWSTPFRPDLDGHGRCAFSVRIGLVGMHVILQIVWTVCTHQSCQNQFDFMFGSVPWAFGHSPKRRFSVIAAIMSSAFPSLLAHGSSGFGRLGSGGCDERFHKRCGIKESFMYVSHVYDMNWHGMSKLYVMIYMIYQNISYQQTWSWLYDVSDCVCTWYEQCVNSVQNGCTMRLHESWDRETPEARWTSSSWPQSSFGFFEAAAFTVFTASFVALVASFGGIRRVPWLHRLWESWSWCDATQKTVNMINMIKMMNTGTKTQGECDMVGTRPCWQLSAQKEGFFLSRSPPWVRLSPSRWLHGEKGECGYQVVGVQIYDPVYVELNRQSSGCIASQGARQSASQDVHYDGSSWIHLTSVKALWHERRKRRHDRGKQRWPE